MSRYSEDFLRSVLTAFEACGENQSEYARQKGIPRGTAQSQVNAAKARLGCTPTAEPEPEPAEIDPDTETELRALRVELSSLKKDSLTQEYIRRKIVKLADMPAPTPRWVLEPSGGPGDSPGVPTLFASDWHWAEVVDPTQIGGVNRYDVQLGHDRARRLISSTADLLMNHIANPNYPGIVFALGGDMVTGNIHEELVATNEIDIMPTVLDLFGVLKWCIATLADQFGRVFVPCVSGNHGRDTHKIRMKGRNFTSFDWLIYQFLEKHFESDRRVTFFTPNGSDALYRVFNHTYLLTHGDQFRGGDGMIGALGPIIRGDHRKRGRQAQIGQAYDTMLLGHWHQYIHLGRLIVNGSLKGYDEYAYQNNFGFEQPKQALWLTHPKYGITFSVPVNVGEETAMPKTDWVSWAA